MLLALLPTILPSLVPTTGPRLAHRNYRRRCRTAVLADVAAHPVLGPVAATAERAVTDSTGAGGESSGSGRPEWGTWCDEELFAEARAALNRVALQTAEGDAWSQLRQAAGGGDAPSSTLRLTGGGQWDLLLHLFAPAKAGEDESRALPARHQDGVLALVRPLLGCVRVSKLRPSGDVIGTPRELQGGVGAKADGALLQIGGPRHEYEPTTSTAACLELVLRHEVQQSSLSPELPELPSGSELLEAFRDRDAPPPKSTLTPPTAAAPAAAAAAAAAAAPGAAAASSSGSGSSSSSAAAAAEAKVQLAAALESRVGGLEGQLDAIVRRVLASRADPAAARRLGVSHVRGILLSGPPGCGKTLLARELARSLGAREPQIVNGPEIMDKFVGEAEKRVRELFAPAEAEYAAAGDASELHVIVFDEMDAVARKRGALSGDTTGVRDSVVNQLLAKMDGVVEAGNVLVVGLTNRPELLDDALLRPGRLEVQLQVSLPDLVGRRDILRIHTRAMRQNGALADDAAAWIEEGVACDADGYACWSEAAANGGDGLPARTRHFSGAELAGLVRSASSFALARGATAPADAAGADDDGELRVRRADFELALAEVTPALRANEGTLRGHFAMHGVGCAAHAPLRRELLRVVLAPPPAAAAAAAAAGTAPPPRPRSALLVGEGGGGGAGTTALAAWAAAAAAERGAAESARLLTTVDLTQDGGSSVDARCAALVAAVAEAAALGSSVLVLDDVDRMLAAEGGGGGGGGGAFGGGGEGGGGGGSGPSPVLLAALHALLRQPLPPPPRDDARPGGAPAAADGAADAAAPPPLLRVLATTSAVGAARRELAMLFDETIVVPRLATAEHAADALRASAAAPLLPPEIVDEAAAAAVARGPIGVKRLLQMAERATAAAAFDESAGEGEEPRVVLEAMRQYVDQDAAV